MAGKATVATPSDTYSDLKPQWDRCRDASKGSDAIKGMGAKYLPPLDSHKRENNLDKNGWLISSRYDEYKARALFYNATARTIQGLSGAIFQKAPAVVPASAVEHVKDITLTGEPLEMFALFTTREYLTTGKLGILIDMSSEEATTPRPYWVGYEAENIINWRFERIGGDAKLVFVVLQEMVDKINSENEFDCKSVIQYRVLRLKNGIYTQQIYSLVEGEGNKTEFIGGPEQVPVRRGVALDFIPFATPWAHSVPPLLDLVDVNIAHYRSSADLKHGLHFTALPTPWVSGQKGDPGKPLSMGSGVAWDLDVNGKAGMVEFTGKGLGAVREDMQDMEHMMATLGARLLEAAPHYAETALSVSMRHSSDYATLRTVAQVVEQQLTYALKIHDWWIDGTKKLVISSSADIQLNKVFFDQSVSADELRALLLALQGGSISYETFYTRLANTGWTREGIDAAMELAEIKKDGDRFKQAPKGIVGTLPSEQVDPNKPKPNQNSNSNQNSNVKS